MATVGEVIFILLLLGGLVYFIFDSNDLLKWMMGWVALAIILIFLGFGIGIGIHFAKIVLGW